MAETKEMVIETFNVRIDNQAGIRKMVLIVDSNHSMDIPVQNGTVRKVTIPFCIINPDFNEANDFIKNRIDIHSKALIENEDEIEDVTFNETFKDVKVIRIFLDIDHKIKQVDEKVDDRIVNSVKVDDPADEAAADNAVDFENLDHEADVYIALRNLDFIIHPIIDNHGILEEDFEIDVTVNNKLIVVIVAENGMEKAVVRKVEDTNVTILVDQKQIIIVKRKMISKGKHRIVNHHPEN